MLVSLAEQQARADAVQRSHRQPPSSSSTSSSSTAASGHAVPRPLPNSRFSPALHPPPPSPSPSALDDVDGSARPAGEDDLLSDLQQLRLTPASATALSSSPPHPPAAASAARSAESPSLPSRVRPPSSSSPSPSALQALLHAPSASSPHRSLRDNAAAKRLVMGALGLRPERSAEEKAAEREKRMQHRQQRRKALDDLQAASEQPAGHEQPLVVAAEPPTYPASAPD